MKITTAILCCLCLPAVLTAADFPPITDAEKALTEVPGQPGASALVLFKKGRLRFMNYPTEPSSSLEVAVRLKILTEEGKDYGEVEIPHSGFYRLRGLRGRTVLSDGSVLALPKDSIFEERRSRSLKSFVTKLVFPGVDVGAILDYTYTVKWDNFVFSEPWYFHSEIPTRLSEITYIKPGNLALRPWGAAPGNQAFSTESRKTSTGLAINVSLKELPGVPDEPFSLPFEALSSRFMMIPTKISVSGTQMMLLESWETTCEIYVGGYKSVRRKNRQAKKLAAQLTAGDVSLLDKIETLHAYVRDEIRTSPSLGVGVAEDEKADRVIKDLYGVPVAKALTLQAMLDAIKVDSDLIWVADRTSGFIDFEAPSPWWFDAALVRVMVDGEPIFLDPVDRSVGFRRLAPYYEGTRGLLVHQGKPEIVELPRSAIEDNSQRAVVNLEIDEDGRIGGHGTLELQGHQAWRFLRWEDGEEATADAWAEHLSEKFEGYDVDDIEVEEDIRKQHLLVAFSLRQREEDVLGDEVTVQPSLPIGPLTQPFTLPPELRRTPVRLLYGKRDDVILTLTFPEGWEVDVLPKDMDVSGPAGAMECRTEHEPDAGKITFRRRFELAASDFTGSDEYRLLRDLYQEAVSADAQNLVLVRN